MRRTQRVAHHGCLGESERRAARTEPKTSHPRAMQKGQGFDKRRRAR
jgi:hypothetical protein